MDQEEELALRKLAVDHARGWFTNHADQRLTLVRFFLILVVATLVAYMTAVKEEFLAGQMIAAIFGMVTPFLFKALDKRVAYLVKVAEAALEKQEEHLAERLSDPNLNIVKRSDEKPCNMKSFRQLFFSMYVSVFVIFALALIFTLISWSKSL